MKPKLTCPMCSEVIAQLAHRAGVYHARPEDGDRVICYRCKQRAVWHGDVLRAETPAERAHSMECTELLRAQCESMFRGDAGLLALFDAAFR